jgi:hypothetical protein
MTTIQMLKKDAQINITVSTGYLQKIQQMLIFLVGQRTEQEMETLKDLITSNATELPEEWMEHIALLSSLITTIEQQAISQGATYEVPVDGLNATEG